MRHSEFSGRRVLSEGRSQHTLATTCAVEGRGFWSGKQVRVTMHPAPVNTGVVVTRVDQSGPPSCKASTDSATAINFRTNLHCGTHQISMVEHLLAALAGLEIDNCFVEMDAEEVPGLDGSSRDFVEAITDAGLVIQAGRRARYVVRE
ncbi:MAG: UDP-3-O-acyl-N-acetylglucosamine deacetylase, partial [Planctomycetota bacterium]